jgi:hypothetical protein
MQLMRGGAHVVGAAALVFGLVAGTSQAQVLPRPTRDDSIDVSYYCLDGCFGDDTIYAATVARLMQRVGAGPYARLGLVYSVAPDMPWDAPLDNPTLTSPTLDELRTQLDRAEAYGIHLSFSLTAGTSRSNGLYDVAAREDRRNFQWFMDGSAERESFSRYARKLRRHLEAKMRAFAAMLVEVIQEYPDTFGTCAGDGEVELSSDRLNEDTPYQSQILADYSPFTILEFRDWVRHTGMYGTGGKYEGQGRAASGVRYVDDVTGLANFNQDFGTPFTTWDLKYFNWSLDDPIDHDPEAIKVQVYSTPAWTPFPTSGPNYIAGGFDAPRSWNQYSAAFWQLWLEFRQALVTHYVADFTGWVMSTRTAEGLSVPPDRWYTYQVPADYLWGTYPGCPQPDRRLLTSASPESTADVGDEAGLGVTVFDEYWAATGYKTTSGLLFPVLAAKRSGHWGMIEFNLSWPIIGGVETNVGLVADKIYSGYQAGCRLFGYFPWLLDPEDQVTVNMDALGQFVARVKYQPRDAPWQNYLPPQVTGVTIAPDRWGVSLSWNQQIFQERNDFRWSDWPAFATFQVWWGSSPDFTTSNGQLLAYTWQTSVSSLPVSAELPYYKVLAVSSQGGSGELSSAVRLCPGNPPSPVLQVPDSAGSGTSYTVSWTATSQDDSYELQEATEPTFASPSQFSVTGTSRSFQHEVTTLSSFYYRVRAREVCNDSPYFSSWSDPATVVINPPDPCAVTLANQTAAGAQTYTSCGTLTAGPAFAISASGNVTFDAAVGVMLANGFSVAEGATFKARLDPSLAP